MEKLSIEQGLAKYRRFIRGRAYRLAKGNHHDAEDIISEAIVIAYTKEKWWLTFESSFSTWFSRCLYNAMRTFKYGCVSTRDGLNFSQDMDQGFVDTFHNHEDDVVMPMSEIQAMPHPNVAVYRYMGYENQEIADLIGVSVRTVKSRAKENADYYQEKNTATKKHKTGFASIDFESARKLINYDSVTGVFTWKEDRAHNVKAGDVCGSFNKEQKSYNIRLNRVIYKGHRLAWAMHYGISDFGNIECIDGNRNYLAITNLKEVK